MNRKTAAALAYDAPAAAAPDGAPRVIAKGYGIVADRIIERAKEAGLYVHESPEMVTLLMQVDLDSKIPPQLYKAVAELLAWLHQLEAAEAAAAKAAHAAHAAAHAPQPAEAGRSGTLFPGAGGPRFGPRVAALPPFRTSSSD